MPVSEYVRSGVNEPLIHLNEIEVKRTKKLVERHLQEDRACHAGRKGESNNRVPDAEKGSTS